jgi:hypothetical protein
MIERSRSGAQADRDTRDATAAPVIKMLRNNGGNDGEEKDE